MLTLEVPLKLVSLPSTVAALTTVLLAAELVALVLYRVVTTTISSFLTPS